MMIKFYFKQARNCSLSVNLWLLVVILFLYAVAVPSVIAQSEIHYSDQWADDSVEDELQAVGVGITEADYETEADSYTVETRLQNPTGETVSVTTNGFTSTRAEVTMPWNFSWGNWFTSSFHRGFYTHCTWDDFIGDFRCRSYRLLLASTYDNAEYADQGPNNLLYRKETQRLVADYCPYVICLIHEDSYCASGRRGITRYDGGGPGLDTCPAGYEREFRIVSVRGYRLFCVQRAARFLSFNPC